MTVSEHLTVASPAASFAHDVLVVHALHERDAAWARSLITLLEDRGVRVCTAAEDAVAPRSDRADLARLITTSLFTVPVLTPRFSAQRFEALQAALAEQLGIEDGIARLIPIVREPCEARLGLRSLSYFDMIRDSTVALGVDRLVRTLRRSVPSP